MSTEQPPFDTVAAAVLAEILDAVDAAMVRFDVEDLEGDIENGILTIEHVATGRRWIVNKHAPNRQLWLSSPRSGASHYAWDDATGRWRSIRGGDDLFEILTAEFTEAAGRPVTLPWAVNA